MDQQVTQEPPLPNPADFTGSPFRMLPRIGDKMYRPARGPTAAPAGRPSVGDNALAREPGVWDWG